MAASRLGVALLAGAASLALLPACGGGDDQSSERSPLAASRPAAPCPRGEAPPFRVPSPPGRETVVAGCVRLGMSGKRTVISVNTARFQGKRAVCLNPAFAGRGSPGMYIPGVCVSRPGPIKVYGAEVPRQGVRGYRLVVWGLARGPGGVHVSYDSSQTQAVAFAMPPAARKLAPAGSRVFATELPLEARCEEIIVRDDRGNEDRVPPRRYCARD